MCEASTFPAYTFNLISPTRRRKTYPCGQQRGLASVYEVNILGRIYRGIL